VSGTKCPHKEANRLALILDTLPPEEHYPVDVKRLALELTPAFNEDPITEVQGHAFNRFEGALLKDPANPRWGIFYNTQIEHPGRIRFTLAHELGHYMLHRHSAGLDGFECGSGDMLRYDTGYAVREEEANAFAASLLMPTQDFRYQMENERFSFDLLNHCAERYGVSLTSAVLRWLEFTPQRAIAVFSEDGYMHWAKSSDKAYKSGKYFATRSGPIPVPAGSQASKQTFSLTARDGVRAAPGVWFEDEAVVEYTLRSEEYEQTLTVLMLDDAGGYDRRDEAREEDTADRF
jgi:Zn-dependent peptidase ImmA (M78 family)